MLPNELGKDPGKYVCKKGNETIQLTKTIKFKKRDKKGVAVFFGKMGDREVVVKWHRGRKSSEDEENFYLWLKGRVPCAEVFPGWYLEGERVLVMEKLQPIGKDSDPIKIGLDILKQLKVIHKRCVHNGIKPDNIVYKRDIDKYLLIDYGSIADTKLDSGYERKSWPVGWSSQPRKVSSQVTYPENDLIELAITLKSLARNKLEKKLFEKMLKKTVSGYDRHRLRKWLRKRA
jgi:hypothetical protein